MSAQLKQIFTKNLGSLLFIAFIFLSIFLIWSSSQSNNQKAKELVNYFFYSGQKVLDGIDELEKKANKVQNTKADYDAMILALNSYGSNLGDYASQIPSGINDSEGIVLQNSYRTFLNNLKNEKVGFLNSILTQRQQIVEDYQIYGNIKILSQKGGKAELSKNLAAGERIIQSEETISSKNPNAKDKVSQEQKNKTEKELLIKVKDFLNTLPDGELSEENRKKLAEIYVDGWPLGIAPLPRITSSDFKDQKFVEELTQIQNIARNLAKKYEINNTR